MDSRFDASLIVAIDRDPASVHLQDLLAPDDEELAGARAWVDTQDIGAQWPDMVKEVVDHVRARRSR